MSELSDKILELRSLGYTYTYISDTLQCSKSTVSYYCGAGQKDKNHSRTRDRRSSNFLLQKIERFRIDTRIPSIREYVSSTQDRKRFKVLDFQRVGRRSGPRLTTFTLEDVESSLGSDPKCYLSGRAIDLDDPRSFELDHRVPRSRGGDNSFENLGISSKEANRAKGDMTVDELLVLCTEILENNGYVVTEKSGIL